MNPEIKLIQPAPFPYDLDAKIFCLVDSEGEQIGDKYSFNDFLQEIKDISGVSEEFLGRVGE